MTAVTARDTDAVLAGIDAALADAEPEFIEWHGSADSARWSPEPTVDDDLADSPALTGAGYTAGGRPALGVSGTPLADWIARPQRYESAFYPVSPRSAYYPVSPTMIIPEARPVRPGDMPWNAELVGVTVLTDPTGRPIHGTNRMVYVEYNLIVAEGFWAGDVPAGRAENLAETLGLAKVASGTRQVDGMPFDHVARGLGVDFPMRVAEMTIWRSVIMQGWVAATWTPVAYPLDGDWRPSWFADNGQLVERAARYTAEELATDKIGVLRDPLDDLAKWYGVTAELAHMDRWQPYGWMPEARQMAYDGLQARRDSQAGGQPLWAVNLLPEPLRDRDWCMFACRVTDVGLIHPETVGAMRSRLGPAVAEAARRAARPSTGTEG